MYDRPGTNGVYVKGTLQVEICERDRCHILLLFCVRVGGTKEKVENTSFGGPQRFRDSSKKNWLWNA